jgi:Fe-S oxidoreductase
MDTVLRSKLLTLFEGKLTRPMELYLRMCARCGICTPACHVHHAIPETKYTPAARAEVVRQVYKKYFKARCRIFAGLCKAPELDFAMMEKLKEAAYSCTGCRRCMVYCPYGIDTQQIVSIAKLMLIGAEMEPETLTMLADMSIGKGEHIDDLKEGFTTGIKKVGDQVVEKWRNSDKDNPIPLDVKGADLLYVPLAGAHSFVPAAAVFNAAGERWTLSFFEAVNFGAFLGHPGKTKQIMDRIINEALQLGVKEVVISECGTAFRVMKQQSGKQPFKVSSVAEVFARYIREGRITVREKSIAEPVIYHDPCQSGRNAGVLEDPRYILKKLCADYREISPKPEYNWCCGGGGGLVAMGDETYDFRMKTGMAKAEQIKEADASILVTACENCHTQLGQINEHYKLGVNVEFLTGLVADALVQPTDERVEDLSRVVLRRPEAPEVAAVDEEGTYVGEEELEKVVEDCGRAIASDPNNASAYFHRGEAYAAQSRMEEAIEDFSRAVAIDPDYALAWFNRGDAYAWLEQYEEAVHDMKEARRCDPTFVPAHFNLGEINMILGRYDLAIENLTEALKHDPEDAETYQMRGLAYITTQQHKLGCKDLSIANDMGVSTGFDLASASGICRLD